MSLVRRLHSQESARIEQANEQVQAESAAPPTGAPETAVRHSEVPSPTQAFESQTAILQALSEPEAGQSAPVASMAVPSTMIARGPQEVQSRAEDHQDRPDEAPGRDLQALLGVLRTMGPIFKATMIYPGQDAAPTRIAAAVGTMAGVAAELSRYLSQSVDVLELDMAWKRKQLQEFTTGLVADYWISSVISRGGVPAGDMPSFSIETFRPALDGVMQALQFNPSLGEGRTFSQTCALAIAQAVAPLSLEIEHFVRAVHTHVPALSVDGDALLRDLVDFVIGQVELHGVGIQSGFPELGESEQHELLDCLVTQFNGILLFAWEQARGEALGVIKDAASAEDAAIALSQPAYQHGVALSTFKILAAESIKRLVGTAQYAYARLTPAVTAGAANG